MIKLRENRALIVIDCLSIMGYMSRRPYLYDAWIDRRRKRLAAAQCHTAYSPCQACKQKQRTGEDMIAVW
jgi:hypothetical protein